MAMKTPASQPRPVGSGPMPRSVAMQMEAAKRLGLQSRILDPEYGHLFEISDGQGRALLLGGKSPLNDAVAARLAEDKFYTGLLLARAGLATPATARCLSAEHFPSGRYDDRGGMEEGLALARERGFPVVVKPNRGSLGRGVVCVDTLDGVRQAVHEVWRRDPIALVQEEVPGPDLRLDFLDGSYLTGYLRRPIQVVGDGRETLRQLVPEVLPRARNDRFWDRVEEDPLWDEVAGSRGLAADSVLSRGEVLDFATPILNLNRWCTAELVADLPPPWLGLGLRIGEVLGLRHYGVDFKGAGVDGDPSQATTIEVNASPLLLGLHRQGYEAAAMAAQVRVTRAIASRVGLVMRRDGS